MLKVRFRNKIFFLLGLLVLSRPFAENNECCLLCTLLTILWLLNEGIKKTLMRLLSPTLVKHQILALVSKIVA